MRKGNAQVYFWGWFADYPDPENYLFLLTSSQGKVKFDGENASNYSEPEYDKLYDRMKSLPDGPERMQVIDQMVKIVQRDAPWSFGIFPGSTGVYQQWLLNAKPSGVIQDKLRYVRIDGAARAQKVVEWNQPKAWPLLLVCSRWRCCCGRRGACGCGARMRMRARRRSRWRRGGGLIAYLIRRTLYAVLVLIGINFVTFFLFFSVNTPDDMARLQLGGKRVAAEAIERWKAERGYDKPLYFNTEADGIAS
jgi:hypothetical protein